MQEAVQIQEEENKRTGLIISLFVHAFLIFLFLIPCFNYFNDKPPTENVGIFVALGNPDNSELTKPAPTKAEKVEEKIAKVEKVKEVEKTSPSKKSPSKSKPSKTKTEAVKKAVISEITDKESEVIAVKKKTKKKSSKEAEAKKNAVAEAKAEAAEAEERAEAEAEAKLAAEKAKVAAQKKAEADAKAKAKAEKAAAKSKFSSLFNAKGSDEAASKGETNGHPDASVLEGLSTGTGKMGKGLGNRGVLYSPKIEDNSQRTGKVIVDICVDKNGKVIHAKYTQKGSTTTDAYLIDLAESNAKKYKFHKSDIDEQCGEIMIDFQLK